MGVEPAGKRDFVVIDEHQDVRVLRVLQSDVASTGKPCLLHVHDIGSIEPGGGLRLLLILGAIVDQKHPGGFALQFSV